MALYAIGDIQGCYDDLQRLLEQIRFDHAKDRIWFAGDLVNRGPDSLRVLRFVKGLGPRADSVLGNHDLHLLALSEGNLRHRGKDHTLDQILNAPDRDELLHWLRHRPLLKRSRKRNITLIHAGLPPQWDLQTAIACARELETALRGDTFHDYCRQMYGNEPRQWSPRLNGMPRLRFITNCLTRLRYCDRQGRLAMREKGAPGSRNHGILPWFRVPGRKTRNDPIVFGHWSTLGYLQEGRVHAIDTGCLWGGRLTALKVPKKKPPRPIQIDCPGSCTPGE